MFGLKHWIMTLYKYLLVTRYKHCVITLPEVILRNCAKSFSGPRVSAMFTIRSILAIHMHRPPKLPQKFSKHTVNETNSGSPVGMVNTHCSYWGLTGADPNFGGVSPIKLNSQPPGVSPKLFQPPIRFVMRICGVLRSCVNTQLDATKTSVSRKVSEQNISSYCSCCVHSYHPVSAKTRDSRQQIWFHQFHPSKRVNILTQVKYTSTYQCANKHLVLETPWHTFVAQ